MTEGYGLWTGKNWGRLLAIISTALYLPFEFYELNQHYSSIKISVIIVNIAILIYVAKSGKMSK